MSTPDHRRRQFLELICGAAGAALAGYRMPRAQAPDIADLLELRGDERAWLTELSDRNARRLLAGLTDPDRSADAARVIAQLLNSRTRLSSFVHYPQVGSLRLACDGLIRD